MKKILAFLFCLFTITLWAQKNDPGEIKIPDFPRDSSTGKVYYSDVILLNGLSKDKILTKAEEWFQTNNSDLHYVLQVLNIEEGRIVLAATFNSPVKEEPKATIHHKIVISVKDGKCRIQDTDFSYNFFRGATAYGTMVSESKDVSGTLEEYINEVDKFNNKAGKRININNLIVLSSNAKKSIQSFRDFMTSSTNAKQDNW